jgi:hypothetical protein
MRTELERCFLLAGLGVVKMGRGTLSGGQATLKVETERVSRPSVLAHRQLRTV